MASSRSLNRVMLIGNLSRDPVIRITPSGATVCTFGIATNTVWRDERGELQERTEFHNIVAWNRLAEICAQILSVGMLVYVGGEIRTRNWNDAEGIKHYRSEVRITDMKLLDSKEKTGVGVEAAKVSGERIDSASPKRKQVKLKEQEEKLGEKGGKELEQQSDEVGVTKDEEKKEKGGIVSEDLAF